jgi:CRP-like cAMP-binding protein
MAIQYFVRSPLLSRIPEADLRALVRRAEQRAFYPGQLLFQRGEPGDGVFAIVSGHVKVFLEGSDGTEVIIRNLTTGDVLGEMSLLDDHKRSASCEAMDHVTALRISTEHFRAWLTQHPAAALAMMRELAERLRTTTDQVAEIALLDIDARIARRLWQLFSEAAGGPPKPGMELRVNQADLASAVGVTRESVNKHLARMKSRSLIAITAGRVTILEPDGVRQLAQEL